MTEETQAPTKVFISYSWDSEAHKDRVLALANTLRNPWGIETDIDRYVRAKHPFTPPQGWDLWMEKRIEWAEFVLIVCTETYQRRFRGDEEPGIGRGSTWEGTIIRQHLYNNQLACTKFIPVVFSSQDLPHIPIIFNGSDKYILEDEKSLTELCYRLRKEPIIAIPDVAIAKLKAPLEPKFFTDQTQPPLVSFDASRTIKVRVHRAFFTNSPTEYYFINVTNLSPVRLLEITHIWYEDDKNHHISVAQPSRTLPVRLDLDQSWETWISVNELPVDNREHACQNFYVRISTGDVFKSEANLHVPLRGTVPGGAVQTQQMQQRLERVYGSQIEQTSTKEIASQQGLEKQEQPTNTLTEKATGPENLLKLEDLLKAEKIKEADEQTRKLILMENQNKPLTAPEIRRLSLDLLDSIDRLWMKYSAGKFGLKVQQQMWQKTQEPEKPRFTLFAKKIEPLTESQIWNRLGCLVGWRSEDEKLLPDSKLNFSIKAPPGCFPRTRLWLHGGYGNTMKQFVALMERVGQME
ncbi:GUN4 domain-containing protein [Leptolyngbya sp. PCC 6406]|uniref:GUN4 domain-containing protein n=1 Tax=Leptolyngbya sp. PCC 6406 TaxID=1173264 RepID=UPI0002ABD062|nr:GUN4 domain-containing protein [Leptolyngbya sp. PCC 6406]